MKQIAFHRPATRVLLRRAWPFALGAGTGAFLMYLLDPERGRARRRRTLDRAGSLARRGRRRLLRGVRVGTAQAIGHAKGLAHRLRRERPAELDDVTLAHKVESVLFREPWVPKGAISVNAEEGVVFLRGQVETAELVRRLEERVRRIEGVRGVQNLLHLPGMPAPTSRGGRLVHP